MTDAATQLKLLTRFMAETPFQPATNFLRCIEIPNLAAALPKTGIGLDIGCGDGTLAGILADLVGAEWTLTGIDPDPAETALARTYGRYERLHTTGGDAVPEAEYTFDFAFSNSVLEHIPDPRPTLKEVARVMKPGGLFAATVPSSHWHDCLAGPGLLDGPSRERYLSDLDVRLAHHYYWTAEQWSDAFRQAGMEPQPVAAYLCKPQVQRWERLANWTGGLAYKLARRGKKPVALQHSLGLRRSLPKPLTPLAPRLAGVISRGRLGLTDADPAHNGCWLLTARKPI